MSEGNTPALAFAASKFTTRISELEVSIFLSINEMTRPVKLDPWLIQRSLIDKRKV